MLLYSSGILYRDTDAKAEVAGGGEARQRAAAGSAGSGSVGRGSPEWQGPGVVSAAMATAAPRRKKAGDKEEKKGGDKAPKKKSKEAKEKKSQMSELKRMAGSASAMTFD